MSEPIDMLSVEELAELVELRREMERIQGRYNALVSKLRGTGTTMPSVDPVVAAAVAPKAVSSAAAAVAPPPTPAPAPAPAAAPGPAPTPVAPKTAPASAPSAPAPAAPPKVAVPAPSSSDDKVTVSDRCRTILAAAPEAGLSFEQIYTALEGDGHPMPESKPKLQVRAILQKNDDFEVVRGLYKLK